MASSITFKSVAKKSDGKTVLADLSFGIEERSAFALVGRNRSGKSLILRLLSGLSKFDKGNIYIKGQDILTRSNEIQSIIGYMPQSNYLNEHLKPIDNLMYFCKICGMQKKEYDEKINFWANRLGLTESDLNASTSKLSFSTIRKIIFVRSIIHDPEILLFDEPTRGMDSINASNLWDIIDSLKKIKTIIFCTSDLAAVERYSDRIGIINNGSMRMLGTMDSLINSTEGISLYEIDLEGKIDKELMDRFNENKKILKPEYKGHTLSFYSREKKYFFMVLKEIIDLGVRDIKLKKYKLSNIIENMVGG